MFLADFLPAVELEAKRRLVNRSFAPWRAYYGGLQVAAAPLAPPKAAWRARSQRYGDCAYSPHPCRLQRLLAPFPRAGLPPGLSRSSGVSLQIIFPC